MARVSLYPIEKMGLGVISCNIHSMQQDDHCHGSNIDGTCIPSLWHHLVPGKNIHTA